MHLSKAELLERSYLQWALIRALAFGERDWMLLCAVFLFWSEARDFLTVPGFACFLAGAVFLGPVFGIMIYFVNKGLYFGLKKRGRLPATIRKVKLLTWKANLLCLPVIVFAGWQMFNLFFESYDSLARMVAGLLRAVNP